jgi:drug/metabolite transporter (DMT)-like permease
LRFDHDLSLSFHFDAGDLHAARLFCGFAAPRHNSAASRMNFSLLALERRWSRLAPNVRGAIWLVFAGFVLISMSSLVKSIGPRIPAAEMLFFRGAVGAVFLLPLLLWYGWRSVATRHPGMHLLRAAFGTASMFGVFYAVTHLPLADATAILFSSPLFATVFAAIILREAVGWRRALATLAGFSGVLVMMRPGGDAIDPAALVAIGAALLTGALAIIIRRLSGKDSPYVIVFWFTIASGLISLPVALAVWVTPTAADLPLLVLIGLLGLVGQTAFTFAFSSGESSAIAPFDYMRLLFAGLFGYIFFAELPDIWSLTGAAVIMTSTFYIMRREARLAKARRAAAAARTVPAQATAGS